MKLPFVESGSVDPVTVSLWSVWDVCASLGVEPGKAALLCSA